MGIVVKIELVLVSVYLSVLYLALSYVGGSLFLVSLVTSIYYVVKFYIGPRQKLFLVYGQKISGDYYKILTFFCFGLFYILSSLSFSYITFYGRWGFMLLGATILFFELRDLRK